MHANISVVTAGEDGSCMAGFFSVVTAQNPATAKNRQYCQRRNVQLYSIPNCKGPLIPNYACSWQDPKSCETGCIQMVHLCSQEALVNHMLHRYEQRRTVSGLWGSSRGVVDKSCPRDLP